MENSLKLGLFFIIIQWWIFLVDYMLQDIDLIIFAAIVGLIAILVIIFGVGNTDDAFHALNEKESGE